MTPEQERREERRHYRRVAAVRRAKLHTRMARRDVLDALAGDR